MRAFIDISSVSETSLILLLLVSLSFVGICIWYVTSLRPVSLVSAAAPSSVLSSSINIESVPVVVKTGVTTDVVTTVPLGGEKGLRPILPMLAGSSGWNSLVPVSWTAVKGTSSSQFCHVWEMTGVGGSGALSQPRKHPFVSNRVGMSLGPLHIFPVFSLNCKREKASMSGTPRVLHSFA